MVVAATGRGTSSRSHAEAQRAVELAERSGDPLLFDAALDQLTADQFDGGQFVDAAATIRRRLTSLASVPIDPNSSMDHSDARLMAVHVDLALGRLGSACQAADALAALPFLREERHVGLTRRMEVDTIAGEFGDVLRSAATFRVDWEQAGRPRRTTFGSAAYAVAMVHGMRGEALQREQWLAVAHEMIEHRFAGSDTAFLWPAVFDGMLWLERDDPAAALATMTFDPDQAPSRVRWYQSLWLPWYAAAWAEASALGGATDLANRLRSARRAGGANDIVQLVIDRAAALAADDLDTLPRIADRLDRLGCRYQADRTRRLAAIATPPSRSASAAGVQHRLTTDDHSLG